MRLPGARQKLGRKVALKLLPQEHTQDAIACADSGRKRAPLGATNHPNIITIYDIGEAGGIHFIATEYIEGQTLRERLKEPR